MATGPATPLGAAARFPNLAQIRLSLLQLGLLRLAILGEFGHSCLHLRAGCLGINGLLQGIGFGAGRLVEKSASATARAAVVAAAWTATTPATEEHPAHAGAHFATHVRH